MTDTPEPCGCRLGWSKGGTGTTLPPPDIIIYCDLHTAAPALLAALKAWGTERDEDAWLDMRRAAIAKAKPSIVNQMDMHVHYEVKGDAE